MQLQLASVQWTLQATDRKDQFPRTRKDADAALKLSAQTLITCKRQIRVILARKTPPPSFAFSSPQTLSCEEAPSLGFLGRSGEPS